uniref:Uncharacterized protein n=1 Tax=Candidatus Nitrotoga fabula TaxID=2182327 RepID=A0A2X0QTM4_9PROT|nr:protein of unknown function [Candidatus Nitrotoga fabula]
MNRKFRSAQILQMEDVHPPQENYINLLLLRKQKVRAVLKGDIEAGEIFRALKMEDRAVPPRREKIPFYEVINK